MWQFIGANKTKILGIVTTALGFIQSYPGLHDLLTAKQFGWTMFFIGVGVTICGFLNSNKKPDSQLPAPFALVATMFMLLSVVAIAGCGGTLAAYKQATDSGEYAYVLSEHYESLVDQAATLKERGSLPPAIVTALQSADNVAKPVILRLRGLRAAYLDVTNAKTEAELQEAIDQAVRVIADMQRTVTTARGARIGMLERVIPMEHISYEYSWSILDPVAGADIPTCRSAGAFCIGQGARSSSEPL